MNPRRKIAMSVILLIVVLAVGLTWLWEGAGLYPKSAVFEEQLLHYRLIGMGLEQVDVDLLCKSLVKKVGDVDEVIVVLDHGCSPDLIREPLPHR